MVFTFLPSKMLSCGADWPQVCFRKLSLLVYSGRLWAYKFTMNIPEGLQSLTEANLWELHLMVNSSFNPTPTNSI